MIRPQTTTSWATSPPGARKNERARTNSLSDKSRCRQRQRPLFNRHRPEPRADYFNPELYFFVETTNKEKLKRQLGDEDQLVMNAWDALKAIVSFSQQPGIVCYAGIKALAARAGCSPNTFRKWVKPWIRLGMVTAEPRPGDGSGALTILYILQPSVYWNRFDRRPGKTYEAKAVSQGEAKRNIEPKFPTLHPKSSVVSDIFPTSEVCQSSTKQNATGVDPDPESHKGPEPKIRPREVRSAPPPPASETRKPEPELPFTIPDLQLAVERVFRWTIDQDEAQSILRRCPALLAQFSLMAVLYAVMRKASKVGGFDRFRRDLIDNPGGFLNRFIHELQPAEVEHDQRVWAQRKAMRGQGWQTPEGFSPAALITEQDRADAADVNRKAGIRSRNP